MKGKNNTETSKYLVFLWTLAIIVLDQLSKWYIVANVEPYDFSSPHFTVWDGYLNIVHVRNKAIAFSIGSGLPEILKILLFRFMPLLILAYVSFIIISHKYLRKVQRVCLAVIVGGGIGNMLDRFFRPDGVVDFVDTDFWNIDINWGIFQYSLHRWPTYNIADASILVGMLILLLYTYFFLSRDERDIILNNGGNDGVNDGVKNKQ